VSIDLNLLHFLIVLVFSFLIGLEVKSYRLEFMKPKDDNHFFGDVRTFSFIGILGYVLFVINTPMQLLYICGFFSLIILFALLYVKNLAQEKRSILMYIVTLLIYSFGAIIQTQPIWMIALLYVTIVFILNSNKGVEKFVDAINTEEFETLGKMILLSVVILPLLPNTNTIPYIPISPFKIWLAVVVISGISYSGYILQKYIFPSKGYFLTGIIGGSYSSTATTVVLARKSKQLNGLGIIDSAIVSATSVMYLRLIIVALIFNFEVGKALIIPFTILSVIGFISAFFYMKNQKVKQEKSDIVDKNPLELKTAFLFSFLFVGMIMLTDFVTKNYGTSGLEILSFLIGFTDIDPFILSILTGKFSVTNHHIISAIMIASGSNNLLKALYAVWFGGMKNTYKSAIFIVVLGIITIFLGFNTQTFLDI